MSFASLLRARSVFTDVTGFTVAACQLVYYTTFVLGMAPFIRGH